MGTLEAGGLRPEVVPPLQPVSWPEDTAPPAFPYPHPLVRSTYTNKDYFFSIIQHPDSRPDEGCRINIIIIFSI
jgi:hypothetical protein